MVDVRERTNVNDAPPVRTVQARRIAAEALEKADGREPSNALAAAIERLVNGDPQMAQRFLAAMREEQATGKPWSIIRVLASFGVLSEPVAEAAHPTPLKTEPTNLGEVWAMVGNYIQSGMDQMDARRETHGD